MKKLLIGTVLSMAVVLTAGQVMAASVRGTITSLGYLPGMMNGYVYCTVGGVGLYMDNALTSNQSKLSILGIGRNLAYMGATVNVTYTGYKITNVTP